MIICKIKGGMAILTKEKKLKKKKKNSKNLKKKKKNFKNFKKKISKKL